MRPDGSETPVLVLFRHDLRLSDNRALRVGAESGRPVLPVFVLDEESKGMRPVGGARRWWLHHSLSALARDLEDRGARLVLRRGRTQAVVEALLDETGADRVLWNRRYDPPGAAVDAALKEALRGRGIDCESFEGQLLHEPTRLKTGAGGPFRVYSPFWRALTAEPAPRPAMAAPRTLRGHRGPVASDDLRTWGLLPTRPDWAGGLRAEWTPGEAGALARLKIFLAGAIDGYGENRDRPGMPSTSRLSPHLAHGEITPFQIWQAVEDARGAIPARDAEKFLKEVVWREFSYHLLFHNPDLAESNYNRDFDGFRWQPSDALVEAWRRGRTGYPIVDAGMRELWQTGWMHNRVRMICASFLIKHLLQDWREGERWFWDTLVDADPASNAASWQWVAGSGADAAPYFRIFNPILQGEKFDGEGDYVRRFVPELGRVPDRFLHHPADAPALVLAEAGVKLGRDYPVPAIDHALARDRAMAAYTAMKGSA
ncbi:cryptochrome/photolyase family protein [Aquibium microcysteis]|uniref:cryptochrome/photolyase family protein n=1 Tax=Aquibium microcysteis TaxID=675281 RepID=UPI00165CF11F|nr:deoxyribodipyrimidine photo-lyase [Aquibium microcysteis]